MMGERGFGHGGWGAEGLVTDMLVPLLGMLVQRRGNAWVVSGRAGDPCGSTRRGRRSG